MYSRQNERNESQIRLNICSEKLKNTQNYKIFPKKQKKYWIYNGETYFTLHRVLYHLEWSFWVFSTAGDGENHYRYCIYRYLLLFEFISQLYHKLIEIFLPAKKKQNKKKNYGLILKKLIFWFYHEKKKPPEDLLFSYECQKFVRILSVCMNKLI